MAPVIAALRGCGDDVVTRVCVTGQHREMLNQVMDTFGIVPDMDLDLMRQNQSLAALTSRAIEALHTEFDRSTPDLVLVQGDTTTAFCAALAAFYSRVPVGHVEAGLRTWNPEAPWPEETNRVLISHLATLHFAPTKWSRQNLLREGVAEDRIFVTGNTVVDALQQTASSLNSDPAALADLAGVNIQQLGNSPMVLITGHRRENFGPRFEAICTGIRELAHRFPHTQFVYPVHLNPNVREPVTRLLGVIGDDQSNIHLIEPIAYKEFVALMSRCTLILTDSGGIQEEAPSLGKPVLIMRDTTERPEAIEAGCAKLIGATVEGIVQETSRLLTDPVIYAQMAQVANPFGDGRSAERIVDVCTSYLGLAAPYALA